ncbi:MAG: hypothetical protein WA905_14950, partial [Pseudolabrys sp.]
MVTVWLLDQYNRDDHATVRQGHIDLDQPAKHGPMRLWPGHEGHGGMTAEASQQPVIDFLSDPAT